MIPSTSQPMPKLQRRRRRHGVRSSVLDTRQMHRSFSVRMLKGNFVMSTLRTLAPLASFALVALTGFAQAAPRDPSGTWLDADGKARIRVEKCGPQNTQICGYAVWLKVPLNDQGKPRVDFRNPDPKKQTRASLGHQLILGLKPNADSRYEGKIYNAEDGKTYDVTLWSDEPGKLTVKGCLVAFLCMSQAWTQTNDVIAGQLSGPTNGPNGPRADLEWAPKAAPAVATGTTVGTPAKQTAGTATKPISGKPAGAKPSAPADATQQPED